MKKFITIVLVSIITTIAAQAQTTLFTPGDNQIRAGLGFSSGISNTVLPPVFVSYEKGVYAINDKAVIGVGGFAGGYTEKGYSSNYLAWTLCAHVLAHYSITPALDVYAGPFLGYISVGSENVSVGSFARGMMLGGQYFFSDRWGAFLQLGGLATVNLGASYRF